MALTQEQIDKLKEGDTLLLAVILERKINNCTFKVTTSKDSCVAASTIRLFHPSEHGTSVPTKYDPRRLFRAGDKVRVVEWNGRKDCRNGMVATVLSNEQGCFVDIECMIKEVKAELTYPACQLELVTPVEEIEPYKVWDTTFSFNVGAEDSKAVFYYGADMSTCPYTKEQAAAAAEAECERLNAEQTRKEQS